MECTSISWNITLKFIQCSYFSFSVYINVGYWKNMRNHSLEKTSKSSSPAVTPTPPCLINHIPKCNIYTFLEHLQWWWLPHFPGQPIPMYDHSFHKEIFPNIHSKPPPMQLEAIASCPIASYLGEDTSTCLTTTSFQGVVESNKVPPQPPLLQTKQPQFPQLFLIRLVLWTLHQPCCSSLDTLQQLGYTWFNISKVNIIHGLS